MCGICGKISYNSEPFSEDLLRKMCLSFSCRGPDDEGIFVNKIEDNNNDKVNVGLGHRRLSIIDLSQAGHQPMSNEDQTVWLTFNGEIYNYREIRDRLKRQGHAFKSDTDTEVIIHLYEEEGLEAVNRLNGMFAFALWDEKLERLWVCRDRIGIKPLVYYWNGIHFTFASEIRTLLQDKYIGKEIDESALWLYLAFNYVPAPYTIFKNISKLEPAHYLIVKGRTLKKKILGTAKSS